MCEFFTFLDAFCLIWALAHEIFYRNIKYIMLMQLILMGGNAKYTERCVKQIFVEYSCNNFEMKRMGVMPLRTRAPFFALAGWMEPE